jgi:Tol biopolymer transport system component
MRSPTQARVQSIRQLTDDGQAKDEFARIDTDGSRVYFTEKYGGTFRLAQVAVSGGQVAPISTQIPAPYSASVAPDFSGLVVSENPLGRHPLWFQPLPAGAPRRLGNLESDGAVFAPQGTHIVYVNGAAVYSANRDGEEARKLSELPGIGFCPAVSPDGKTIRVTVIESKGYSLWELGTDGKGLHQLSNLGSTSSDVGCGKWTLDGLHFVFQKASVDRTDIWAISENTWFVRHSMSSAAPLTNGPLSCSQPSPSIDGKEIFARCAKLRGELVRYDRRSQQFTPFLDGISAVDVTYSRDREWVVYVSYPDHALWRMRANGKDRLQLTYPPMIAAYPQISPDSTNIAFMSNEPSPNIYIVNLTGGTPRKVVDQGFYPYWSPDGKSIAFSSPRQTPHEGFVNSDELRTIELQSGRVSVIPQSQGKFWPIWTSEASLVAGLWDNSRLTRYDFRTHRWSDLAAGPFSDWGSTDGTYIYCTTMEPAPPAALRIRISDGRTERIADLSRIRRIVTYGSREFSLTPKGELLFTRDIGTQEIYALDVKWP